MELLVFAHRGEAQHFLQDIGVKPSPDFKVSPLWLSDQTAVLVTGEGQENAMLAVAAALGRLDNQVRVVYSLGVAGALSDRIQLQKIYSIRTTYGEKSAGHSHFKSVVSGDDQTNFDLISTVDRVLTDERALALRALAHLVDREAWAVGMAAKSFGKPFYCFKYVSDKAGSQTDCLDVASIGSVASFELFRFWQNYPKTQKAVDAIWTLNWPGFHITESQNYQLRNLQAESVSESLLEGIRAECNHPKERTTRLIQKLKQQRNPMASKIADQISMKVSSLRRHGWTVSADATLESDTIEIRAKISEANQIPNLAASLEKFDFESWRDLLSGKNV